MSTGTRRPTEPTVTLLTRETPAGLERTVHLLRAGDTLDCRGPGWLEALAVVEHGGVELSGFTASSQHARLRLVEGDAFCLALTGPATLRNPGPTSAVIATVRRTRSLDGAPSAPTPPLPRPHRRSPERRATPPKGTPPWT